MCHLSEFRRGGIAGLYFLVPQGRWIADHAPLERHGLRAPGSNRLCVSHEAYFICSYERVSHAKWPEYSDGYAPTQTGEDVFRPLKAVDTEWDIECPPPEIE